MLIVLLLLINTDSRKVVRFFRGPILVLSAIIALLGGPFAVMLGASVEAFNIGGPGQGGLSNVPGATWQQAFDATWRWTQAGGWVFWICIANFVMDWLVYRSDKKANDK